MARIEDGITGGVSGKIGSIIGAKWKGISYIKTKPAKIKDPKSKKQLKQRSKFNVTLNFIRTATELIKIGFQSEANERKTAYNAAMSYNMKYAVKADEMGEGFELDYEKVMISRGPLDGPADVTTRIEGNKVFFDWDSTKTPTTGRMDDMAMVMAYNIIKCRATHDLNAGKRLEGVASLLLPNNWSGDEIALYIAFKNNDATIVSDSLFAGRIVLQ